MAVVGDGHVGRSHTVVGEGEAGPRRQSNSGRGVDVDGRLTGESTHGEVSGPVVRS